MVGAICGSEIAMIKKTAAFFKGQGQTSAYFLISHFDHA